MDSFELKSEEEFNKEFEKEFSKPLEIVGTDKKDVFTLFIENKTYIYSVLFYIAGLLTGSFIYKNCRNEVLDNILNSPNEEFIQLLLNNLSRKIYNITIKKSDMSEEFNYKTYLKKYLAYAGLIAIVAVINTAVCTALNGIISI